MPWKHSYKLRPLIRRLWSDEYFEKSRSMELMEFPSVNCCCIVGLSNWISSFCGFELLVTNLRDLSLKIRLQSVLKSPFVYRIIRDFVFFFFFNIIHSQNSFPPMAELQIFRSHFTFLSKIQSNKLALKFSIYWIFSFKKIVRNWSLSFVYINK